MSEQAPGGGITPTPQKITDISELLPELHGGVLIEKINRALSAVALGVVYTESKKRSGKVTIEFELQQIGDSHQVAMTHKIAWTAPTNRGKKSETDVSDTPLHVGRGGRLTTYPEKQDDLFREGAANTK
jgi:hypothetical protein